MPAVQQLPAFYKFTSTAPPLPDAVADHFNILPITELLLPSERPRNLARRAYFKVSLVTGHSRLHFPGQLLDIKGPALVFTNPLTPYHWEIVKAPQEGFICIFTEAFLQQQIALRALPMYSTVPHSVLRLNKQQTTFFDQLFRRIRTEHHGEYPFRRALVRCLLLELLYEAQKLLPATAEASHSSSAYERIANRFLELLDQQFAYAGTLPARTPQAFAALLHVHVNHLNKVLRNVTGLTTSAWIHKKILEEAMLLLQNNTASINEIAWSLGFEAPNHFSGFFKRHTGKTPQQFRALQND